MTRSTNTLRLTQTLMLTAGLLALPALARAQDKAAKPAPAAKAAAKAAGPAAAPAAPAAGTPAAAAAAKPAAPEMPKPSAELEKLKVLEGNWNCDSLIPAGAMGPGSPEMKAKAKVKIKKELGGFAYAGSFDSKPKGMPAWKASFTYAFDVSSNQLVNATFDNMGTVTIAKSPGFQGDTVVFLGDGSMLGQKVKVRDTVTTKSAKEVFHKFEADMGKGFQSMGEDTCKK